SREPVQVPDEQQLIVEVVLEPEDDLVVIDERLERGIVLAVPVEEFLFGQMSRPGKVSGARAAPFLPKHERRRTVMEAVRVCHKSARDGRLLQAEARGIAIEDVEEPTAWHTPMLSCRNPDRTLTSFAISSSRRSGAACPPAIRQDQTCWLPHGWRPA